MSKLHDDIGLMSIHIMISLMSLLLDYPCHGNEGPRHTQAQRCTFCTTFGAGLPHSNRMVTWIRHILHNLHTRHRMHTIAQSAQPAQDAQDAHSAQPAHSAHSAQDAQAAQPAQDAACPGAWCMVYRSYTPLCRHPPTVTATLLNIANFMSYTRQLGCRILDTIASQWYAQTAQPAKQTTCFCLCQADRLCHVRHCSSLIAICHLCMMLVCLLPLRPVLLLCSRRPNVCCRWDRHLLTLCIVAPWWSRRRRRRHWIWQCRHLGWRAWRRRRRRYPQPHAQQHICLGSRV